jgi:Cu/Ag efflux pump CusA
MGAGAEVRHALGVTVFAGMLGVTLFGLLLTPVFYVLVRRATARAPSAGPAELPAPEASHD